MNDIGAAEELADVAAETQEVLDDREAMNTRRELLAGSNVNPNEAADAQPKTEEVKPLTMSMADVIEEKVQ